MFNLKKLIQYKNNLESAFIGKSVSSKRGSVYSFGELGCNNTCVGTCNGSCEGACESCERRPFELF